MRNFSKTVVILITIFFSLISPCGIIKAEEIEEIDIEISEVIPEEEIVEENEITYNAHYRFFLADTDGTIPLPEEVMSLLSKTQGGFKDNEKIEPENIKSDSVSGFTFLGWEPKYATFNQNDVIFSGIWKADDLSKYSAKAPKLKAASTLYSGFGSLAWGLKEATYTGTYNFLLGGKQAYCIEIDIPIPAVGTRYSYEGKDSSKLARIIGKGTMNGMSPGAIQATVWNYLAKNKSRAWVTTGESVDYDDSRYSGGSCTISVYSPDGSYQRFALLEGCNDPQPDPQPGYLRVLKKAADKYGFNYVNHSSSFYSLAGAVYGVYTNQACTNLKASLTTKADGSTDSVKLDIGTYYVKEIKPSPGFKLDDKVYTASVPDSGNITVTSVEEPYMGKALLNKVAAKSQYDFLNNCPNNYTLENAVYGIYADEQCSKLVTKISTDASGKTQAVSMPIGTYYIKEISPSYGFKLDENVYTININTDETATVESVEEPLFGPLKIVLRKTNIKDEDDVKYLEETEFTLKYYDTKTDEIADLQPLYTWVFKPIIKDGKAEVSFDKNHYLRGDKLLLDDEGNSFIPLGTFSIEETKAPQTYARDTNVYIGHIISEDGKQKIVFTDGEWMRKENMLLSSEHTDIPTLHLRQNERKIIIKTTSIFEESGNDRYVADGIANVNDLVEYDHLIPGKEYLLKAKLINKRTRNTVSQNSIVFTPENESGTVSVNLTVNLDGFDDTDLVAYEYLYLKEEPDVLISKHEDINDEGQTVHVERLYRASMVLYKIGGNEDVKLNGAIFNVTTRRKRRDGKEIVKDLGRFVSGGIYIEQNEPFVYEISKNKDMSNIRTYISKIHSTFGIEHVCITDLSDGVYYGRFQGHSKIEEYYVEKGMILLTDMPENTKITYTELISPKGYYLNPDPYTVNVGNNDKLSRIDNYRTNKAIIIPKTGIE